MGLFSHNIGLFSHDMGLFSHPLNETKGVSGDLKKKPYISVDTFIRIGGGDA